MAASVVATFLMCVSVDAAPGSLDTGFGRFGLATFDRPLDFVSPLALSPQEVRLSDLERAPDGALVAVGYLHESSDSGVSGDSTNAVVAVRFDADGRVDHGFGESGAFVDNSFHSLFPSAAIDGAGRTHIAFWDGPRDTAHVEVLRLSPTGRLDTGYGGTGRVDLGPASRPPEAALQPDGKLLVAANTPAQGGGQTVVVWRLLEDGSADPAFGDAGAVTLPDAGHIAALAVQPDGRIVLAGDGSSADRTAVTFSWRGCWGTVLLTPRSAIAGC
jgi:uncharacterized delta-60 repeat protein